MSDKLATWKVIELAVKVCAHQATIAELRRALKNADYWPPSKLVEVKNTESLGPKDQKLNT